jgi:hypothetical protein
VLLNDAEDSEPSGDREAAESDSGILIGGRSNNTKSQRATEPSNAVRYFSEFQIFQVLSTARESTKQSMPSLRDNGVVKATQKLNEELNLTYQ